MYLIYRGNVQLNRKLVEVNRLFGWLSCGWLLAEGTTGPLGRRRNFPIDVVINVTELGDGP
jgi:hypothetical protein